MAVSESHITKNTFMIESSVSLSVCLPVFRDASNKSLHAPTLTHEQMSKCICHPSSACFMVMVLMYKNLSKMRMGVVGFLGDPRDEFQKGVG